MYIANAYVHVHESPAHHKRRYIRVVPDIHGTYMQGSKTDRLQKNLWGFKSSGQEYSILSFPNLSWVGYTQADGDPCLFSKHSSQSDTLVAITVNYFLVT